MSLTLLVSFTLSQSELEKDKNGLLASLISTVHDHTPPIQMRTENVVHHASSRHQRETRDRLTAIERQIDKVGTHVVERLADPDIRKRLIRIEQQLSDLLTRPRQANNVAKPGNRDAEMRKMLTEIHCYAEKAVMFNIFAMLASGLAACVATYYYFKEPA
jgi:hypothetical protein